ncbi:MAG: RNA polymerase sigma factor [Sphingobacteriales bacterium]|nr:MAG: RNA polymerase sigma factor [Sphingobacteriales bacterium]
MYNQHATHVLRMCMAYTNDSVLAQDLMQETFIKAWQNLSLFRGDSAIGTWIYRIAVNTCLSHIRSTKNKIPEALQENFEMADDDSAAMKERHVSQLYQAIHALPETDRLIISMVLEEIPYPEIAGSVNISEGNLRVKIHRIKQELTKIFFRHEQL